MEKELCKKVAFSDEKQALFYVDKLKNTSNRPIVPQRAYLCHKCNNWHLTSKQENRTYTSILNENELLKKQLTEKDRIIRDKSDKISEQNRAILKLDSKIKKKEKAMKSIAKIILDSMESK